MPWELFSTGMQDLFSGVPRFDSKDDLQAFTVGVLALLGRPRKAPRTRRKAGT